MPEPMVEQDSDVEIFEALTWEPLTPCEIVWGDGWVCGEKAEGIIRCRKCFVSYFASLTCWTKSASWPLAKGFGCRVCRFSGAVYSDVFEYFPIGSGS